MRLVDRSFVVLSYCPRLTPALRETSVGTDCIVGIVYDRLTRDFLHPPRDDSL